MTTYTDAVRLARAAELQCDWIRASGHWLDGAAGDHQSHAFESAAICARIMLSRMRGDAVRAGRPMPAENPLLMSAEEAIGTLGELLGAGAGR